MALNSPPGPAPSAAASNPSEIRSPALLARSLLLHLLLQARLRYCGRYCGRSFTDSARLQRVRLPIDILRDGLTRDYRNQFATRSARDVDQATSDDTPQAAETFIQRTAAEICYQQPSPAIPSTLTPSHNQNVSSRITRQHNQSASQPAVNSSHNQPEPLRATISHVLSSSQCINVPGLHIYILITVDYIFIRAAP